jgi:CRISPR-associated protein Csm3
MDYIIGLMGNIVIKGTIKAETGLHIGASADTVEIGGIDSPVIKHPIKDEPYVPGSSLKGKMRSFMEKVTASVDKDFKYNRKAQEIRQHVCDDIEYSYGKGDGKGARKCPVCRVYGSTGVKGGNNYPSHIIVRDCELKNKDAMKDDNLYVFEAKMENSIDRVTAAAHPRTFERVPSGAEFDFEIIYKVQGHFEKKNEKYQLSEDDLHFIYQDIKNIFEALSLIEKDGLGGNISRGYGQVSFSLEPEQCKYYKVGGGFEDFLPKDNNATITDLENLRQQDFSALEDIIIKKPSP